MSETSAPAGRDAGAVIPPRLLAYLENSPLAFIRFDVNSRISHWSARAEQIFGWTASEAIGQTRESLAFVHPDDRAAVAERAALLLADHRGWNEGENRNLRKDGSIVVCRWFNTFADAGELSGFFSLVEDVTPQLAARAAAEQSAERLRALFAGTPIALAFLRLDGTIEDCNLATERMMGTAREDLIGHAFAGFTAERDRTMARSIFERVVGGETLDVEIVARRRDGSEFPAHIIVGPLRAGDLLFGTYAAVTDISEQRNARREAELHAERIRDLYLSATAANAGEQQVGATLAAGRRILGMQFGALYQTEGDRIAESVGGNGIAPALARIALRAAPVVALADLSALPHLATDGVPLRGSFIGTPIEVAGRRYGALCFASHAPRATPFAAVDYDLIQLMAALIASAIERGRARERLNALAYRDGVTALPNRTWFSERLRSEIVDAEVSQRPFSVLFLDLDRFKDINDTLGHDSGDRLLFVVGERLSAALRGGDVVARMGGDEFVILAAGASDRASLAALAERIIAAIEAPVELQGIEQFITTSIGIASYPGDGRDAETLVKHSDLAMYRAKERGRNTYHFFTPTLEGALQTRLTQEKSLRRALDAGEFVVYYQPEHDLATGRLVAVEALVRWQHPELGLIHPQSFIPNAERSGLIVALGDYVLETAAATVADLRRTLDPGLRLAVNLSARQLHQQRLTAKIHDCLRRQQLDPSALELEITESVAMNDAALTVAIMEGLSTDGIRISVDDFGTGYSSLGYLRRFPLDSLKIDRSFVTDLGVERNDATIVRTVIAMAHALGLEVVAEGVETRAQLEFLRAERCDRVQGYLFSAALPREGLERYIRETAGVVTFTTEEHR